MRVITSILAGFLAFALTACSSTGELSRRTSFSSLAENGVSDPNEETSTSPVIAAVLGHLLPDIAEGSSPVTVRSVTVVVPSDLVVSEANVYLPKADIVWREDPIGDRHEQVRVIVDNAIRRGVADMHGPVPVDITIKVERFHALTEKARFTTGGVHALAFTMAVFHAGSGSLLAPPRHIRADLDAFGGAQAMLAESRGQNQKVRISDHLAEVIRQELTDPEGYRGGARSYVGVLNYLAPS